MTADQIERFWDAVNLSFDPGECWTWKGKPSDGYGRIRFNGLTFRVHRVSYELLRGFIPDDLVIDHICRNRLCVNPFHLELVTPGENVRRALIRSTHCSKGHPYDREYAGVRVCSTCQSLSRARYYERSGK